MPIQLTNPYSDAEEDWLQAQLKMTDESIWSVPMGEDVIRELLLFSIGVIPSRNFIYATSQAFYERICRVLEVRPEFQALLPDLKRQLVMNRAPAALALLLARQEVMQTGVEQCQVNLNHRSLSFD